MDADASFSEFGVNCRVCEPCFKEYQDHLIHSKEESDDSDQSMYSTQGKLSLSLLKLNIDFNLFLESTNAIPIALNEKLNDLSETPMLSVPTDWTWSTF